MKYFYRKKIALLPLSLVIVGLLGCRASRQIQRRPSEAEVARVHQTAAGFPCKVTLENGRSYAAQELQISTYKTTFIRSDDSTRVSVPTAFIRKISIERGRRHVTEGLILGLLIGGATGYAIGYFQGEDCGESVDNVCFDRQLTGGLMGIFGGSLGLLIGGALGSKVGDFVEYELSDKLEPELVTDTP